MTHNNQNSGNPEPTSPSFHPGDRSHGEGSIERTHVWDKPENVQRLLNVFYILCVVLVGMDFFVHRHVTHPWERFFAFHAFYGFVACWTLVVLAKFMRRFLMRDEDYYDVD